MKFNWKFFGEWLAKKNDWEKDGSNGMIRIPKDMWSALSTETKGHAIEIEKNNNIFWSSIAFWTISLIASILIVATLI